MSDDRARLSGLNRQRLDQVAVKPDFRNLTLNLPQGLGIGKSG
jgi:hypothetical protein